MFKGSGGVFFVALLNKPTTILTQRDFPDPRSIISVTLVATKVYEFVRVEGLSE